jgi:hypothetical protein
MRTTIIPAQITSVEDKIAGNLSFTQVLLLLSSLFSTTFIYFFFPERMHFTTYKIPLIFIDVLVFLLLSVRIREKIILQWLSIISTYFIRPKFYIFDKNSNYLRELPTLNLSDKKETTEKQKLKTELVKDDHQNDLFAMDQIFKNPNRNIRLAFKKKGAVHVSIS